MRSFIRAGYAIAIKEKKGTFNTVTEEVPPFVLGLLSGKEYKNLLLVFRKAFREYSIQEFDYFMSGMVYFSLGMYDNLPERNIINPSGQNAGCSLPPCKKEKEAIKKHCTQKIHHPETSDSGQ